MNSKLSFKLELKPAAILAALTEAQPYLLGVFLVGTTAYTAYAVNAALNVVPEAAAAAAPKITFDKTAIESLKRLEVVSGDVPAGNVGKTDPFLR